MKISYSTLRDKRQKADLLIIGVFQKSSLSKEAKEIVPEFSTIVSEAQKKGRFDGDFSHSFSSYGDYKEAHEILLIGLGDKKKFTFPALQQVMGQSLQTAKRLKATSIRFFAESFMGGDVQLLDVAKSVAEMSTLSLYEFDQYKKPEKNIKKGDLNLNILLSSATLSSKVQKTIHRQVQIAEGALLARNLINEPANVLNPERLALEAKKLAARTKLSCHVMNEAELKRLKMGGILGVSQGSPTPPVMIILEHGKKYKSKGTICLVGKGVTFDTGGLSIKPAKGMEKMKYDMSGAAAVIGTMSVISNIDLPMHVIGITPSVENNVAEDPIRPGDIITMHNGKTVEVLNTDAEGRLILADALSYAEKFNPKLIIDLATLTGMAAYTFGSECCVLLGNDEKAIEKLRTAGEKVGERAWQLPMWPEYGKQIRGSHSDLKNIGGPMGGTITAAKFLEEFVPAKTNWVHIDIAGVAWCENSRFDCPIGGTGFGVRLLTEFLSNLTQK